MSKKSNNGFNQKEKREQFVFDESYCIWVLMGQTRAVMNKARARELLEYGVTQAEAGIMSATMFIGHEATPAEISRLTLLESHSVSGLLVRMEKRGVITRTKDMSRKNMTRITLTPKGLEAYYLSTKREVMHRIIGSLTKRERKRLIPCLIKLRQRTLEELGIRYLPSFPPIPNQS